MDKTKEQEAAEALSRMGNQYHIKKDEFNAAMANEHRTIQQGTGGALFAYIKFVADRYDSEDRSCHFDGRNEEFGRRCSEINRHMNSISDMWSYLVCV